MGASVREQLVAAYQHSLSFESIISDHLRCMHKLRELEIRNAQLDKEAGELRLENDTLLHDIEDARKGSASFAELEEAKAQVSTLQIELLASYKESTLAADARSKALEQLEIVRDNYAKQTLEIEGCRDEDGRLRTELNRLRLHAEKMEQAKELAVKELEAREAEIHASRHHAAALEDENRDLVDRILSMKDAEAERMNEMNRLRDDMLNDAKRQAAEIIAQCKAALIKGAGTRGATGILDASMQSFLDATAGTGTAASLPAAVFRSHPAVHKGGCFSVSFDISGSSVASCGADKLVRVWDVINGTEVSVLRGAHEGLNDIAFTCDSHLILGAEDKHAVRVWDARTGRLLNVAFTGHTNKVTGVATSPSDLTEAVTCSADRTIKLWKVDRGVCQRTFLFRSVARRLTISPDLNLIASAHYDGRLRFWDMRSKISDPVHEIEVHGGREMYSVACSSMPGGSGGWVMATLGRDAAMSIVDTRTFSLRDRLTAPGFEVDAWAVPAVSPTGSHVVAGSKDGTLYMWDISSPSYSSSPSSFPSSPSSTWGRDTGGRSHTILKKMRHPKSASMEQQHAPIVACAWSPTGLPVVCGDKLGGVTFWKGDNE